MTITRLALTAAAAAALVGGSIALAQREAAPQSSGETRSALQRALTESKEAEARGLRLEAEALEVTEALEKTATQAAAMAARIQQTEANIAAAEARIELIDAERAKLRQNLAVRREPLIRLTGALQKLARRPLALSALKPGSVRETVYLRAMLENAIPHIRQRTADLRAQIKRGQALEAEARQALAALEANEAQLTERRSRLTNIESRQRLAARQARGEADREKELALALAEEALDLDALVAQLDAAGNLRQELAALPGPIIRPNEPQARLTQAAAATPLPSATAPSSAFQLPVTGRTIAGFGEIGEGDVRNTGISLSPRDGAQVVAPAEGRVAFAGTYRGYDRIVIIEHDGGWTSLITGLARADVAVGDDLVAGSPLGVAGAEGPIVTLELRRNGTPVNPLEHIR